MPSATQIERELESELERLDEGIAQRELRRRDVLEQLREAQAQAATEAQARAATEAHARASHARAAAEATAAAGEADATESSERPTRRPEIHLVFPRKQQDALDMLSDLIAASERQGLPEAKAAPRPQQPERVQPQPTAVPAEDLGDRYYRGIGPA